MLPESIVPMEPVLVSRPPEEADYLHSVKWDGVRQLVFISSSGVRIQNRKLRDRTDVYPELHEIKKMVSSRGVVFDGEVIALNEYGKPDFAQVMRRDNCRSESAVARGRIEVPIFYMIFDLLFYRDESIMHLPLTNRLELLQEVLPSPRGIIQLVGHEKDGNSLFEKTRDLGLEGVVSKEAGSKYHPGAKNKAWVKAKHFKEMAVVVGGFTTRGGVLNSLSAGVYGPDEELYYLGNVSTGLSNKDLIFLDTELRKHQLSSSPFANLQKKAPNQVWTDPRLTLRVKYLEITREFRLRHPVIISFISISPKSCRYNIVRGG